MKRNVSKKTATILAMIILISSVLFAACSKQVEESAPIQQATASNKEEIDVIENQNLETTTIEIITETQTEPDNLYDTVLSTGYYNGDSYKLVAKQIDGYPNSKIEIGVIKNNEWLIPMNSDSPFLDENGWWINSTSEKIENMSKFFHYIGYGCFANKGDYYSKIIIFKPETNISFTSVYFGLGDRYEKIPTDNELLKSMVYENNAILFDGYTTTVTICNMDTGETNQFKMNYIISDVVIGKNFFWADDGDKYITVDFNGNIIGDFSTYRIHYSNGFSVTNSIIFDAYNENYVLCKLTCDKYGNVLKSEAKS